MFILWAETGRVMRVTPPVLFFSVVQIFWVFKQLFAQLCAFLQNFVLFLQKSILKFCTFLHAFFVKKNSNSKLCQCYLSSFLQLWLWVYLKDSILYFLLKTQGNNIFLLNLRLCTALHIFQEKKREKWRTCTRNLYMIT